MKSFKKMRSPKARHGRHQDPKRLDAHAVHTAEQGRPHKGKRFGRVWYPETKSE